MEIKTYKKDSFYSYTLGAFPSIELLKNHPGDVIKVLVHTSFTNQDVIKLIQDNLDHQEIQFNDKLISKLASKENCYVVTIFNKYRMKLDPNESHLMLVNPMNMGNLGTIIRSALGFGFNNIAIIKPCADIFDPKVLRSAMGAFFSCNIQLFNSLDEYKAQFGDHKMYSFMLQAKTKLQEAKFDPNQKLTLIFGNESSGLDISYLNDDSIIIEHSNKIDSLNLPTAVGISLYEARKQLENK